MRRNHDLAVRTLAHIAGNMAEWNQSNYRTCFAGHALRLSGYELREVQPGIEVFYDQQGRIVENGIEEARAELGFSVQDAQYVFMYMPRLEDAVSKEVQYAELEHRVSAVLGYDNDTDFPV